MNKPEHKSKDLSELTHEEKLEELACELERLRKNQAKRGVNLSPASTGVLLNLFKSPRFSPAELQSLLREYDAMISAVEQVHRAIVKKNKDEGVEALEIFLVAFENIFAPHTESFRKMFPKIESIKDDILAERFDDANIVTIAFLAHFRQVREGLART